MAVSYTHLDVYKRQVEEQVKDRFPEARVLRMDYDTTRGKNAHEKILGRCQRGEADILVGTQMIAKGLDFANVTLVGVMAADSALYLSLIHICPAKLPHHPGGRTAFGPV